MNYNLICSILGITTISLGVQMCTMGNRVSSVENRSRRLERRIDSQYSDIRELQGDLEGSEQARHRLEYDLQRLRVQSESRER